MSEDERKLLHTVERHQFIDNLRHDATNQGAFDKAMWHLDHPVPGTDFFLKPSDHGAGAARVYAAAEPEPLWRTLWTRERKALTPKHRAVLDALLLDMRPRVAARIAGVGKDTVYDCFRRIFPQHFAACHRALLLSATQVNR